MNKVKKFLKSTAGMVLIVTILIGVIVHLATGNFFTSYNISIAPSATMTIHPIRLNGMVIGVPQTYEYFDRMQDRVVQFVTKNSNISKERFRELMLKTGELANDVGTILFGEEAVKYGLIDEMGGLKEALKKLYELIAKRKKNKNSISQGTVQKPEGLQ